VVGQTYELGGHKLGIRSTSRSFGTWLDAALAPYRVDAPPDIVYSLVVDGGRPEGSHQGRRFHIIYQGGTAVLRTLSLETFGRGVLAEAEANLLSERDDLVYTRACLLAANGSTALVPWWVGSYVGDLGRRAERAGVALPMASWVAIDPESASVVPAPRLVKIPAKATQALGRLSADGEPPDRSVVERPVSVDTVWTFLEDETEPVLRPVSRALALHRLAGMTPNLRVVGTKAVHGLARLVERAVPIGFGQGSARALLRAMAAVLHDEPLPSSMGEAE
jgi:hypothetical protein